ncbi:MAG: NUDIX hydrolase [Cyanobacteria bacterium J06643_4]
MTYQAYIDSLPKKRMGAGCLFFDDNDRFLILKPSYRGGWLLPGGVVEKHESPMAACIREVREEMGVICQPKRLLCLDYVGTKDNYGESLQFVFWGGVISINDVEIDNKEIVDYCFTPAKRAIELLVDSSKRRVYWSLEALRAKETFYLENHERV